MNQPTALRIVVIDDESSARDLIRNLLSEITWVEIAGEADSVDSALPLLLEVKPHVILLDIQMPRKDGFVLLEEMVRTGLEPEVVFITAFEQYAIQAIKASAFDYLLKPVKKSELIQTLTRLQKKMELGRSELQIQELLDRLKSHKKIKFRNRTGFTMIDPAEILYCEADSNYTMLELTTGKSLVVSMNLGKVEELLPQGSFCRISRSNLVNIQYLTQVDRKSMRCELVNQVRHTLPISRKYISQLEEQCDRLFNLR